MDTLLNTWYQATSSPALRLELATAGLANASLWLGWLCSLELFNLRFSNVTILEPTDALQADLPLGMGYVKYYLGPETKSNRTIGGCVLMAYHTWAGLKLGRWFHRVRRGCRLSPNWHLSLALVFQHPGATPWNSAYFCHTYLYPSLQSQLDAGDTYLRPFSGHLSEKFWSLHCYCHGARTHVSRLRPGMKRKTTLDQVYKHGCWRH